MARPFFAFAILKIFDYVHLDALNNSLVADQHSGSVCFQSPLHTSSLSPPDEVLAVCGSLSCCMMKFPIRLDAFLCTFVDTINMQCHLRLFSMDNLFDV